jgi:hypothetical protein
VANVVKHAQEQLRVIRAQALELRETWGKLDEKADSKRASPGGTTAGRKRKSAGAATGGGDGGSADTPIVIAAQGAAAAGGDDDATPVGTAGVAGGDGSSADRPIVVASVAIGDGGNTKQWILPAVDAAAAGGDGSRADTPIAVAAAGAAAPGGDGGAAAVGSAPADVAGGQGGSTGGYKLCRNNCGKPPHRGRCRPRQPLAPVPAKHEDVDTNANGGVEEEDDDFNWEATLTNWQRKQMKVKLFTLAEVLGELADMWQQFISACKTLGVGERVPQKPSVIRAHQAIDKSWGFGRAMVVEKLPAYDSVRSWLTAWQNEGVLKVPQKRGRASGRTWYVM